MRVAGIERRGERYLARDARGATLWTVELPLDMNGSPFREAALWPAASAVVVAGGPTIHFLSPESGAVVTTLLFDDDLFGGLGPTAGDVLYILGWRHVTAVDKTLAVRWVSRDVAVDGITLRDLDGDRILLSAEMDPPGGWINVELDAVTGRLVR